MSGYSTNRDLGLGYRCYMIPRMVRFVSRAALVVTICYAALVAVSLIAAFHSADPEVLSFDLLFIGFPWVLAMSIFRSNSLLLYFISIILNVASVYIFVLALVRIFSSRK
jgi:hypothetical protein